MVLKGSFYVRVSPLPTWVQYFWCKDCFWCGCLPLLSSECAGHYLLDREYVCCGGDNSIYWMLDGASSLLWGCHDPIGGRVYSQNIVVEVPRSSSKLQCEVGGTGVLMLEKELLRIPPQELVPGSCTLWHHMPPGMCAHSIHCYSHCP